jgi:septal ring factor EnvC (AmiA/AmiB activator)
LTVSVFIPTRRERIFLKESLMHDGHIAKLEDLTVEDILRNMDKELRELANRLSQDADFSAELDEVLSKAEDHILEARHKITEL